MPRFRSFKKRRGEINQPRVQRNNVDCGICNCGMIKVPIIYNYQTQIFLSDSKKIPTCNNGLPMVQPPIIDKISALIKNNQLLNDYRTCLLLLDHQSFNGYGAKKIYRLKEDQAFSLSLELGKREKVARHPSAEFLLHSIGGGGDFVETVIAVKML
jgi:hypothetical protein